MTIFRLGLAAVALLAMLAPARGAAAPPTVLPLAPPPPDLVRLLDVVEVPLDKPSVPVPVVPWPAPAGLDGPPPAAVSLPADKPMAALPPSRVLACAGTWLGVASESFECGLARFRERKFGDAAKAFEQAVRLARDRQDVARAAGYWLGESYWQLGQIELADQSFTRLAQSPGRDGLEVWALASSGWTALRLGDFARARDAFTRILAARPIYPLDAYCRFGLALSLYGQAQYEDAQRAWREVTAQRLPESLARDAAFWNGETFARLGQHDRAAAELGRFAAGGPHPLLGSGLMRLGWSLLAEKKYAPAAARLREAQRLPADRSAPDEQDWTAAGLALALIGAKDIDGARNTARPLAQRGSKLSAPVHLKLLEALVVARRGPEAAALAQQLLAGTLEPEARALVLVLKGEVARVNGDIDDARTQYDLARTTAPGTDIARYAAFRLALANFEFREFAEAARESGEVALSATSPDLRNAALILRGEAAYAAGDYAGAEAAYDRLLSEDPQHSQASLLRLSLAWTALRRDQRDAARKRFLEFAAQYPIDPRRPDALVLAAEQALRARDLEAARPILDQVIGEYPNSPRTQFARLNRGIAKAQAGDLPAAQREISDWLTRSPFPPLVGRARVALGAVYLSSGRPADATREFAAARKEGVGAMAALGLGSAALAEGRVDEAERELKDARDSGTAAVTATADYGLAAVAFQRGNAAGFKSAASQALDAAPSGPMAPRLLYVLTGLAVQDKDWKGALATARRLTSQFKDAEVADDALQRVVEGAAEAKAWPTVSEAYQLLRQQYPKSPFVEASRARFAEAELENGRPEAARRELEPAVAERSPAEAGSALVVLGRAREATGDRGGALDAYTRAAQAGVVGTGAGALQQARMLLDEKKWGDARGVLGPLMKSSDTAEVAQAAQALGRSYQGEGNHQTAAEYYMTAAYLAPDSPAGRQAMLGAARSFVALKQPDSAAIVYKKLLAQAALPADVADAARQGLAALGKP